MCVSVAEISPSFQQQGQSYYAQAGSDVTSLVAEIARSSSPSSCHQLSSANKNVNKPLHLLEMFSFSDQP